MYIYIHLSHIYIIMQMTRENFQLNFRLSYSSWQWVLLAG